MTHNEKRYSTVREGQIALFTGAIYGAVHTVTGHPLDTIKSNMQISVSSKSLLICLLILLQILVKIRWDASKCGGQVSVC
jgi:hypothetical protein